jgi:hypothetical protein
MSVVLDNRAVAGLQKSSSGYPSRRGYRPGAQMSLHHPTGNMET